MNYYFASLGIFVSGIQDAEVTKSLVAFEQCLKFAFALFVLVFFLKSVANQVINLTSFQAKVAFITVYNMDPF